MNSSACSQSWVPQVSILRPGILIEGRNRVGQRVFMGYGAAVHVIRDTYIALNAHRERLRRGFIRRSCSSNPESIEAALEER